MGPIASLCRFGLVTSIDPSSTVASSTSQDQFKNILSALHRPHNTTVRSLSLSISYRHQNSAQSYLYLDTSVFLWCFFTLGVNGCSHELVIESCFQPNQTNSLQKNAHRIYQDGCNSCLGRSGACMTEKPLFVEFLFNITPLFLVACKVDSSQKKERN